MKVTDTKEIGQLRSVATGDAQRPGAPRGESGRDRVSTDDTTRLSLTVADAQRGAAGSRAEKLEAIARAVQQGTYRPDPQQIAEQILDDAELAARLQALFRG